MRYFLTLMILMGTIATSFPAFAEQPAALSGDVDLILPPGLVSKDAPFYRGASVKVGDNVLPVTEATTSNGQLAEYQPDKNRVVVSTAAGATEVDKGEALLNVVTAMQASAIATAAGQ